MKNNKWSSLLLEMVMVMVGVFLALMADQWRENRQADKTVSIIEEKIIKEAHVNYNSLLKLEKRLNERYSKVMKWSENLDDTKSLLEQNGIQGIPTVPLASAAWQRANSSQLTNLVDVDIITAAHALYDSNTNITNLNSRMLDLVFNVDSWDNKLATVSFNIYKTILEESRNKVREAVGQYRQFVEQYPLSSRDYK